MFLLDSLDKQKRIIFIAQGECFSVSTRSLREKTR